MNEWLYIITSIHILNNLTLKYLKQKCRNTR